MQHQRMRNAVGAVVAALIVCLVVAAPVPAGAQPGLTVADHPAAGLAEAKAFGLPAALAATAAGPELVVTGEPTVAEQAVIEEQWRRFATAFAGYSDCMGVIEVKVVARAEDWYSNRDVGPIAAFYRLPPAAIVFVEHGKVRPDVLIHEFAHHLDISCGLGSGPVGEDFRSAAGVPSGKGWTTGTSWRNVPAEVFAEAVVAFFDENAVIPIGTEAVRVIDEMSRVPDPDSEALSLFDAVAAASPLYRIGDGPFAAPAGAPQVV
jgi:hypothetical protein